MLLNQGKRIVLQGAAEQRGTRGMVQLLSRTSESSLKGLLRPASYRERCMDLKSLSSANFNFTKVGCSRRSQVHRAPGVSPSNPLGRPPVPAPRSR